jgi:hypothetical protein
MVQHLLLTFVLITFVSTQVFAANTVAYRGQSSAYHPSGQTLDQKSTEVSILTSYFFKTATYDVNGSEQAMNDGEDYQQLDSDFAIRYAYGRQLEMRIGGRYRQLRSQDATHDLTNQGFESYFAGFKYAFKWPGKWRYAFDLQYRQTTHTNGQYEDASDANSQEIILGDDGNEITCGAYASHRTSSANYYSVYFAYNRPPNDLSHEFLYDLHFAFVWRKFALIPVGVRGIYSRGGDPYKNNPTEKPVMNTGVTSRFNSINREYVAPYLRLSFAISKLTISLEYSQIVMGASTDQGYQGTLGVSFNTAGVTSEERKISKFKEYIVEASVVKISPRGKFLKLDKGIASDVEKGMKMDIYQSDFFGGNVLVVSGIVYQVGADWAIVKIIKRYKSIPIKVGFTARGY